MRDGYLGALAARTLGVAPLLRPVTPSRFEPDGPTGRLEVSEVGDGGADRNPVGTAERASQAIMADEPMRVAAASDAPLLPPVDPDRPMPDTTLAPATIEEERDRSTYPEPAADTDNAALGITTLAQAFAMSATSTDVVGPEAGRGRTAERSGASPARVGASDSGRESSAVESAVASPPPVIVRIGRIDVRAGEAAPRPMQVPRAAAAQVGRSLADQLAARDRELS